jgi:hypothetical protein
MKKIIVTLAVGLAACAVQANITLTQGTAWNSTDRTITIAETAADTFSAVASVGTVAPTATGDATSIGNIGSFAMTMNGYVNWGDVAGAAALAGGTAETYISGLTGAGLGINGNNWGVIGDGSNFRISPLAGDPLAGQAVVLEFDTTGLTTGYQLSIESISTYNHANGVTEDSIIDYYVYNTVSDTITDSAVGYDLTANGVWNDGFTINDGDLLIMKMSSANTDIDGVGMFDMSFDVIPEPATLGLISAFGGGLLFFRRRFMI